MLKLISNTEINDPLKYKKIKLPAMKRQACCILYVILLDTSRGPTAQIEKLQYK